MKDKLLIKWLEDIKSDIEMGAKTITNQIILEKINKLLKELE